MPDQPSQLPKQQFSATNSDTRSQTRISRLEERVRQLEQGKQLVQTPIFKWEQPTTVTNVTTNTWTITLPIPTGPYTGSTGTSDIWYWFKVIITPVGGGTGASGNVKIGCGTTTNTWTYPLGTAGLHVGPSTGAAVSNVYVSAGTSDKSVMIQAPLLLASALGATADVDFTVEKTGGTGTGVTLTSARFYAMIPPTFTS